MHRIQSLIAATCLLAASLSPTRLPTPAPAPLPASNFTIPTADGQTATACILPTHDGQAFFVYSTPTGQLGSYLLTPTNQPQPPDPIDPPEPPVPPPPVTQTAGLVITVTESTPYPYPTNVATILARNACNTISLTVTMVATLTPPDGALTWIGATANKPYPYTFIATRDGKTLWEGQTPPTETLFLETLSRFLPTPTKQPYCPTGTCPKKRSQALWPTMPR